MKGKVRIFILSLSLIFIFSGCASFSAAGKLYNEAKVFVREGRQDFAFLSLNELLRQYPGYRFVPEAKFAIAEYNFENTNFTQALKDFTGFLKTYKNSKLSVFAKSFVYKIINDVKWLESKEAAEVADSIKKEFFSGSVFFVFSEFKEKRVVSLLNNKYVLKEYVDRIDIFKNDKLFLSVSP